jgi:hypothetical protein
MATSGATSDLFGIRLQLRQEELSWRKEDYGFVLYDRRTDGLYEGNHIGSEILKQFDDGTSIDEICAGLHACYAIPLEQAASDVGDFVQFLIREDLVERC